MIRGKRKYTAALAVAAVLALTGCAQGDNSFMAFLGGTARQESAPAQSAEPESALDDLNRSGIYDSEDAAVVVRKDLEAGTVQFQNIASSRRYTLSYDGTTTIYDKNDQALSMEQLKEGSVVTVRFYKPRKALAYVK